MILLYLHVTPFKAVSITSYTQFLMILPTLLSHLRVSIAILLWIPSVWKISNLWYSKVWNKLAFSSTSDFHSDSLVPLHVHISSCSNLVLKFVSPFPLPYTTLLPFWCLNKDQSVLKEPSPLQHFHQSSTLLDVQVICHLQYSLPSGNIMPLKQTSSCYGVLSAHLTGQI